MGLPRMVRLRRLPPRPRVGDVPAAVRAALAALPQTVSPGDTCALAVGSRGIADLAAVCRAAIAHLAERGARPFVVPAMGSHGGATAAGQRAVLERLGLTERSLGCPVRATMEVVRVGEALGQPVWIDRAAAEADCIAVINRVKPHTAFQGSFGSGLLKMLALGLGNERGASQCHRAFLTHGHVEVIEAAAREVLSRRKVAFGLGIVENAFDESARIEAFSGADLERGEHALFVLALELMPRLPFSEVDVLIVDEMGKDVSGTGMDTNVIGRRAGPGAPPAGGPSIRWIVVLDLTAASAGNANGIGLADLTTARLEGKLDREVTLTNSMAACNPTMARLPAVFADDRAAVEAALALNGLVAAEDARVVHIRNTAALLELEASESLAAEMLVRDDCKAVGQARPLRFTPTGDLVRI